MKWGNIEREWNVQRQFRMLQTVHQELLLSKPPERTVLLRRFWTGLRMPASPSKKGEMASF